MLEVYLLDARSALSSPHSSASAWSVDGPSPHATAPYDLLTYMYIRAGTFSDVRCEIEILAARYLLKLTTSAIRSWTRLGCYFLQVHTCIHTCILYIHAYLKKTVSCDPAHPRATFAELRHLGTRDVLSSTSGRTGRLQEFACVEKWSTVADLSGPGSLISSQQPLARLGSAICSRRQDYWKWQYVCMYLRCCPYVDVCRRLSVRETPRI